MDGDLLYKKSVAEILIENGMEYLLLQLEIWVYKEPIHLNDIQPVNFDGMFGEKATFFIFKTSIWCFYTGQQQMK